MPGSSKWSLSFGFPHQNPIYTSPIPIHATYPAHLILDLFTWIIMGEESRSCNSSCTSFHSPVTSPLLSPNIHLGTLFSNTFIPRSSLNVMKFHANTKQQADL
jgi:hypothetical protein